MTGQCYVCGVTLDVPSKGIGWLCNVCRSAKERGKRRTERAVETYATDAALRWRDSSFARACLDYVDDGDETRLVVRVRAAQREYEQRVAHTPARER